MSDCFPSSSRLRVRMDFSCARFAGTRVTVMGLGLPCRGFKDTLFLVRCGAHNRANVRALTLKLGVDDELIRRVVENFPGVPHRLEWLGEKDRYTPTRRDFFLC